jgi:hypothetical protein
VPRVRENRPIPATDRPLGLRERKKLKTRQAIRREAQPPELSPTEAIRRAYTDVMARLPADQLDFENTRQRLMFSIPELKAAMYDEYYRTANVVAELIGRRIGRAADDFEVRVFAGALTGAMMAAFDGAPQTAETIHRALDFVDAGMRLG